MWGTDLLIEARWVRHRDGRGVLFDAEQQPIQVEIGRWAAPWRLRRRDRFTHPFLQHRAQVLLEHEIGSFRDALQRPDPALTVSSVPLLSSLTNEVPGLHFAQEDLRTPVVPGPFALIRCANLLHRSYFSDTDLVAMARTLYTRLAPDGLLLVTRSEGRSSTNRGTMFRHIGDRLTVEATSNGGSEVTSLLIEAFRP